MITDPSPVYISTSNSTFTYRDLTGFATRLEDSYRKLVDSNSSIKVLIFAEKNIQTAFLIAACFIRQIPMVILPMDATRSRIVETIKATGVSVCIQPQSHLDILENLGKIDLPDLKSVSEDQATFEIPDFNPEALFAILFTSGTTSEAKAVPLKFKHILHAVRTSTLNLPLNSNDEWLLTLPLHHIGGISILIRSLLAGSQVFLSTVNKTEELRYLFLTRRSITHASLVPTQLKRLMEDPDFSVGPNFKALLLGGGPISMAIHRNAISRNIPVIPSFGMTETVAQCIAVPFKSWQHAPEGTSGIPLDGIDIDLRWDDTSARSTLLWIKGLQVFDGYLDESLNATAFDTEGWFNTGDYARIDEKGYIFIEMRRSDRIVSGGENVNPVFVEEILETNDNIAEAGIFGIHHEEWGQIVGAAIVLKDTNLNFTLDDLKTFLKALVPGFMIPKKLFIVDRLPRTASGKLIRSELVKMNDV